MIEVAMAESTSKKLFVGNLGADVTEQILRDAFASYSSVTSVRLAVDGTGKSRGYGFVVFSSLEEAEQAFRAMRDGSIKGRRAIINWALMPDEWYEQPMHDLGLDEGKWNVVIPAYEKYLVERNSIRPGDDPKLQALLMYVLDFGTTVRLEKVLAAGANPNLVMTRGQTPLGKVIGSPRFHDNRVEAFRLLLEAGADPTLPSERKSLITIAKERGQAQILVLLRDLLGEEKATKADLNVALFIAAAKGSLPVVQRLLADGVPANPPVLPYPLVAAAVGGHLETVQALLAAGADVNRKDPLGHTTLDRVRKNRKVAQGVIPLLLKAGAVSGKPLGDERESTHNFVTAMKASYRRAVAKAKQRTGAVRRRLRSAGGEEIPGAYGFVVAENRAREIVEEHQNEFLSLGACLFFTRDLTDVSGSAVALLPTTDVYRAIAAVETQGPDSEVYNPDLIKWLRKLEEDQPFVIFGIGRDFIEGKFTSEIKKPVELVKRICKLCPDGDDDPNALKEQAEGLKRTRQLLLWWD
jgi:ankyrin repeat protein